MEAASANFGVVGLGSASPLVSSGVSSEFSKNPKSCSEADSTVILLVLSKPVRSLSGAEGAWFAVLRSIAVGSPA